MSGHIDADANDESMDSNDSNCGVSRTLEPDDDSNPGYSDTSNLPESGDETDPDRQDSILTRYALQLRKRLAGERIGTSFCFSAIWRIRSEIDLLNAWSDGNDELSCIQEYVKSISEPHTTYRSVDWMALRALQLMDKNRETPAPIYKAIMDQRFQADSTSLAPNFQSFIEASDPSYLSFMLPYRSDGTRYVTSIYRRPHRPIVSKNTVYIPVGLYGGEDTVLAHITGRDNDRLEFSYCNWSWYGSSRTIWSERELFVPRRIRFKHIDFVRNFRGKEENFVREFVRFASVKPWSNVWAALQFAQQVSQKMKTTGKRVEKLSNVMLDEDMTFIPPEEWRRAAQQIKQQWRVGAEEVERLGKWKTVPTAEELDVWRAEGRPMCVPELKIIVPWHFTMIYENSVDLTAYDVHRLDEYFAVSSSGVVAVAGKELRGDMWLTFSDGVVCDAGAGIDNMISMNWYELQMWHQPTQAFSYGPRRRQLLCRPGFPLAQSTGTEPPSSVIPECYHRDAGRFDNRGPHHLVVFQDHLPSNVICKYADLYGGEPSYRPWTKDRGTPAWHGMGSTRIWSIAKKNICSVYEGRLIVRVGELRHDTRKNVVAVHMSPVGLLTWLVMDYTWTEEYSQLPDPLAIENFSFDDVHRLEILHDKGWKWIVCFIRYACVFPDRKLEQVKSYADGRHPGDFEKTRPEAIQVTLNKYLLPQSLRNDSYLLKMWPEPVTRPLDSMVHRCVHVQPVPREYVGWIINEHLYVICGEGSIVGTADKRRNAFGYSLSLHDNMDSLGPEIYMPFDWEGNPSRVPRNMTTAREAAMTNVEWASIFEWKSQAWIERFVRNVFSAVLDPDKRIRDVEEQTSLDISRSAFKYPPCDGAVLPVSWTGGILRKQDRRKARHFALQRQVRPLPQSEPEKDAMIARLRLRIEKLEDNRTEQDEKMRRMETEHATVCRRLAEVEGLARGIGQALTQW